jgi:Chaperone of endosialidase
LLAPAAHATDGVCDGNQSCGTTETELTFTGTTGPAFRVSALSTTGSAVNGTVSNTAASGVAGFNLTSKGNGVYGSSGGTGVYGTSSASGYAGVEGQNSNSGAGIGVLGSCAGTNCWTGYFDEDVYINGNTYPPSDERLKKNITPVSGAIDQLLRLRGVTFEWKEPAKHNDQAGTQIGFIAQEVEKVFPNWVRTDPRDGYKTLSVAQVEALEVESIRNLDDRLKKSEAENDALRREIAEIGKHQQAEIDDLKVAFDQMKNGTDPISGGPGFGHGVLALFGLGLAGASGLATKLALKRVGVSFATVVGLLLAGRKKDDENRS